MPLRQLLAGSLDDYEDFLQKGWNANLLTASSDFGFQISTTEAAELVVREVQTSGSASNQYEQGDAFVGLMLSHPPGWFSSSSTPDRSSTPSEHHTLHWHFPGGPTQSHHQDSRVTYVRLESSRLLRALAGRHLGVDQLRQLQGARASDSLVVLIGSLSQQLLQASDAQGQSAVCGLFLESLVDELAAMLPGSQRLPPSASAHVAASIEIMASRYGGTISLEDLARELNLTTRAVQASFKARLQCSPMRWLKLHRLSLLHQRLLNPLDRGFSIQQLMHQCGLPASGLTSQAYRLVYGRTPNLDRITPLNQSAFGPSLESLHFQFSSTQEAIRKLEEIQSGWSQLADAAKAGIRVTIELPSSG